MNLTLNRRGFLQHLGLAAAGLGVARLPGTGWAAFSRSGQLPRSAPEAQGVASAGLLEFLETVDRVRLNLHSLMVLRHGQVVAEGWWAPYASGLKHTLYSLSKSFTSTAVGLAVAEGRLRVDDKVVSFFPKAVPATVSDNLAAMRVKDLLMMGAGHAGDSLLDGRFVPPGQDWIATVLGRPVPHVPGTHFAYNNGATFLLSAIVQQLTGQTVHEYLKPRLFQPLGIAGTDWEQNAQGINNGAWGLRVKTEDIAKLGQLYLQKGQWRGQQILSEAWVNEATQAQISNAPAGDPAKAAVSDWAQGYGYQFWRCRHGVYRGDGAFGQFCIVLPAEDAVIAITAETNDLQGVLNAVWQHLLPALRGEGLTRDGQHRRQLQRQLAALTLPIPAGRSSSLLSASVNGQVYTLDENPLGVRQVLLAFSRGKCVVTLCDAQGEHPVVCGLDRWVAGETDLSPDRLHLVTTAPPGKTRLAAGGAWSDQKTLVMDWRFVETAHYQRVTCRFEGDTLRLEIRKSLALLNPAAKDSPLILIGKRVTV